MSAFRFRRRSNSDTKIDAKLSHVRVESNRLLFERLEDRLTPAFEPATLVAQGAAFGPTGVFNFQGAPSTLVTGDFNGDGREDFAGLTSGPGGPTSQNQHRINVYLSTAATGKGFSVVNIPTPTGIGPNGFSLPGPASITAIDLTRDGKPELVVGYTGLNDAAKEANIVTYRLDNTGVFSILGAFGIDLSADDPAKVNAAIGGVAGGDFNNDGVGDFVVTLTGSPANRQNQYYMVLNQGNGKSFNPVATPLRTGGPITSDYTQPVAADFDQDGNLDFAMLNPSNNTAYVMFGDGTGSIRFSRSLSVAGQPTSLTTGDYDGNGKVDLAVGLSNGSVTLFLKDLASTTFTTKAKAATAGSRVIDMSTADYDLDGFADIAITAQTGGTGGNQSFLLDIFLGNKNAATVALADAKGNDFAAPNGTLGGLVTGDFDRNGNPDIIVGTGLSSGQQYTPYWNQLGVGGETFLVVDQTTTELGDAITYDVTVCPPPRGGNLPTGMVEYYEVFTDTQGNQTFNLLGSDALEPGLDSNGKSVSLSTFTTSILPVGQHSVVAKFLGDTNYLPTTTTSVTTTVTTATTITTVSSSVPNPVFGQPVTLNALVTTRNPLSGVIPPGTVVFFDNGGQIGVGAVDPTGKAAFTVNNFTLGTHAIQARYLGASDFNPSASNGINLLVDGADSTTTISIDKTSATFGDLITLSSTVSISAPGIGIPSGTVDYFEAGVKVGSGVVNTATGKASAVIAGLPVGPHTFVAVYSGTPDGNANANPPIPQSVRGSTSASTVSVTINPTVSVASLSFSPAVNRLGTPVTLMASVSDTQTPPRPVSVGTVTFTGIDSAGKSYSFGPVSVNGGIATQEVTGLPLGLSTFTAKFSGTSSIQGASTDQVSITTQRSLPNAIITNSAGATGTVLGKDVTFTTEFQANPGLPSPVTGTATYFDNGRTLGTVPLVDGKASITTRLSLGGHAIVVQYSGDVTYETISPSTNFNVVRQIDPVTVGAGSGGTDIVRISNPDGSVRKDPLFAFGPDHTSGARVTSGDVNGDGVQDIIIGTGPGTQARVRVFDGFTSAPLLDVFPFEGFTGGVFVSAGDVNGDLRADFVVTPDVGGGPRVTVYDGGNFKVLANFFGIEDKAFRGGARAAIGDINGDAIGDLVVAAGNGGGPRIAAFDGKSVRLGLPVKLINDFFAYEQTLRNGTYVAVGDVDGDGFGEIIAGAGPGGGPRVIAVSGKDLLASNGSVQVLKANFFAGDASSRVGVPVAVRVLDGDNKADIVTGSGPGGRRVSTYLGVNITPTNQPLATMSFDAFDDDFNPLGGVFVG